MYRLEGIVINVQSKKLFFSDYKMCAYTKKRVYTHVGSYLAAGIKMHCPSLGENVSTVILLPLGLDGAYSLTCISIRLAAFYSIKMHLELVKVMYDN